MERRERAVENVAQMKKDKAFKAPVLVTGATGMLGSWLVKELSDSGADVVAIMRDDVPASNLFFSGTDRKITVVHGCLEDYPLVERAFNEYEIETCFHLAAQTIVPTANRSPLSTFESNIKGTWNLLEAARNSSLLKRLVVASSDKAYGSHDKLPYTEDFPLKPRHPYDASKACGDLLAQSYFHTYGLPLSITRCGNIYGGGDLNYSRVVPGTIRSIYLNENPQIRSDGTLLRDYLFVRDIVNAYLLLAKSIGKNGVTGEVFNFGTESPLTVLQIVEKILSLSKAEGLRPAILGKGKTAGEIEKQYLSSEKARKTLGWTPGYTIEEGLSETIKWYQDYFSSAYKR